MYEYFGGVTKILVPDNCKTAVTKGGRDPRINTTCHEMAEHYGTAILPARIRAPKDKPNVEGTAGNISTWITAALRDEQFFSMNELNRAIRKNLEEFSKRPFQKKEGSRYEIFRDEELHTASIGDYIVRGAFGEIYSCRASIFEHDHESVLK